MPYFSKLKLGYLAALANTLIFASNYHFIKILMPDYMSAKALILFRALVGSLLFWGISMFTAQQKIARKHYGKLFLTGILLGGNMITFFVGLNFTTAISASIISSLLPLFTLIIASIYFKTKIQKYSLIGIFLGFLGTICLIMIGKETDSLVENTLLGNGLLLLNNIVFANYLIMFKSLLNEYNSFTILKWVYLISLSVLIPFGYSDLQLVDFVSMPLKAYAVIGFLIIAVTLLAGILYSFALKHLKASNVAVFEYFQPILTSVIAIYLGTEQITITKVIAIIFILSGVYLARDKETDATLPDDFYKP